MVYLQFVYTQSNEIQYQYDNLNRLTQVEYSNGVTIVYSYDELGNRIGKTITVIPNYDVYFTQTPTIPQDTATAGDVLSIASNIGNRGNTATASSINFYWSLDTLKDGGDVLLSSNKAITKTIAANESVKDSFLVTLPSSLVNSGGYILCVLDDNDNLTELDETNNIEAIPLNIIALPVELLTFTGEKTENGNLLKWTTVSELNNKGFDIERSRDGKNFENIDFVDGQGTTLEIHDYEYLDKNIKDNVTYYRLKQIDFDGAFEYSNMIVIYHPSDDQSLELTTFPNPTNGQININAAFDTPLNNVRLEIVSIDGKVLKTIEIGNGVTNIQRTLDLEQFASGNYFIVLRSENNLAVKRIILTK